MKPEEKKGEATVHTAYCEFALAVHTETNMFAREALATGKAPVDCGAPRSLGSWREEDRREVLAHMNEQRHTSTRFSMDRTKKTWFVCKSKKTTE